MSRNKLTGLIAATGAHPIILAGAQRRLTGLPVRRRCGAFGAL
jgi:hypothetical protein